MNLKKPGRSRDAERIITADDGSAWYTDDHYRSFTRTEDRTDGFPDLVAPVPDQRHPRRPADRASSSAHMPSPDGASRYAPSTQLG